MRWPSTLWLGVRILLPYPVRLILCLFVVLMVFYVVGFNDLHDQDMWQGLAIEFASIIFAVIVIDSLIAYARRKGHDANTLCGGAIRLCCFQSRC